MKAPPFQCVTTSVTNPCFFCVSQGKCLERARIAQAEKLRAEARKAQS